MAFVHWSGFGTGVERRGKMAKNIEKRIWVWVFSCYFICIHGFTAHRRFEAAKLVPCRLRAVCKLSVCGYCLIPGQDANMLVRWLFLSLYVRHG